MTEKRHQEIHHSQYTKGNNFHINVHGNELHVELTYPPRSEEESEKEGQIRHVLVDQESVRASDGIRMHYDYERDGWSIEQASRFQWETEEQANAPNAEDWQEVAFVQSWARKDPNEEDLS